MEPSVTIEKTVNWRNLGKRQVSLILIPRATFMANKNLLASGDVIGFVSQAAEPGLRSHRARRVGKGGEVMLRHASRSRGRVVDDRIDVFLAVNRVQDVTLLRAADTPDPADRG